jgi:hypothetical protein
MSWAKFDDQYPDHPKIVEVGPLGMALHTAATCYCARYLTNGFIPKNQITKLLNLEGILVENNGVSHAVTNKEITEELLRVGLFESAPGGYKIHDYLKYNPNADQVKAEREVTRLRQEKWRSENKKTDYKTDNNDVTNGVTNGDVTPAPSPSPLLKEIHTPNGESEENVGRTDAIKKGDEIDMHLLSLSKPHNPFEKYSEDVIPICAAFSKQSGIIPISSQKSYWTKGARQLLEVGIRSDDIQALIERMGKLTYTSPASLVTTAQKYKAIPPDDYEEKRAKGRG